MVAQKRTLDDSSSTHKKKKTKTDSNAADAPKAASSSLLTTQVDFPRGGGTSFTPLEVKAIRAEATKEADAELFKVCLLLCTVLKISLIDSCPGHFQ